MRSGMGSNRDVDERAAARLLTYNERTWSPLIGSSGKVPVADIALQEGAAVISHPLAPLPSPSDSPDDDDDGGHAGKSE
jgi:hypothetical protein